jgi:hypothetical protein
MANTQKTVKELVSEIIRIAKAEVGTREVGNTNCGVRVRSLEENQAKFLGGMIILNIIGGLAMAIIMKI